MVKGLNDDVARDLHTKLSALQERHQAERRKTEQLTWLVAYAAGEVTEGAAATYLEVDRLTLRGMRDAAIMQAVQEWAAYRQTYPAKAAIAAQA